MEAYIFIPWSVRFKSSPVNAIFCQALSGSPLQPHSLSQMNREQEQLLKPPFTAPTAPEMEREGGGGRERGRGSGSGGLVGHTMVKRFAFLPTLLNKTQV